VTEKSQGEKLREWEYQEQILLDTHPSGFTPKIGRKSPPKN
jgi:hypothetical protein